MTKRFIELRGEQIPVYAESDVVIVGGGVAGIGAALAAARNGKKVTILEKSSVLGGLATLGHVCIYLPLDDGLGNKIFGGIAEELLYTSIKYSYNNLPEGWTEGIKRVENPAGRYRTHFNIPAAILAYDELAEEEGIEVFFDILFSEPIMDGNSCTYVVCDSKEGRVAFGAKMYVDASGDADLMARAGAETRKKKSIVSHWCYELDFETMQKGINNHKMIDALSLRWLGLRPDADNTKSEIPTFSGTTIEGVNGYLRLSRKLALDYLKENQREDYCMITMPFMPQFRTSQHIVGISQVEYDKPDVYLEDSVGCVAFGLAQPSPIFEYPYGGIIDKRIENIAAAGRIVATDDEKGWEMMRLIPACVFTGQVAGTAAALAIDEGVALQNVNITSLQSNLEATGVIIHEEEYMKGNLDKKEKIDPKRIGDKNIKTDALSYH